MCSWPLHQTTKTISQRQPDAWADSMPGPQVDEAAEQFADLWCGERQAGSRARRVPTEVYRKPARTSNKRERFRDESKQLRDEYMRSQYIDCTPRSISFARSLTCERKVKEKGKGAKSRPQRRMYKAMHSTEKIAGETTINKTR